MAKVHARTKSNSMACFVSVLCVFVFQGLIKTIVIWESGSLSQQCHPEITWVLCGTKQAVSLGTRKTVTVTVTFGSQQRYHCDSALLSSDLNHVPRRNTDDPVCSNLKLSTRREQLTTSDQLELTTYDNSVTDNSLTTHWQLTDIEFTDNTATILSGDRWVVTVNELSAELSRS